MAKADFLDEKRNEIAARLNELRPLVEEHSRLQAATAALDSVLASAPGTPASKASTRRRPARRAAPQIKSGASHRGRGRPKGSGARRAETLALVKANPGITVPEIAKKMGIKQNYLYRVLPALAEDGFVVKDGRTWTAVNTA